MGSKEVPPLPEIRSMRDINDFCVSNGIHTLSQGMIELPPPKTLRTIAADLFSRADVHFYRARMGEPSFLKAIAGVLCSEGCKDITPGSILATQGVTGAIVAALLHLRNKLKRNPRVVLLEPFYTYHKQQIEALTCQSPVYVGCNENQEFDWEQLQGIVDGKEADAVLMCNPQNPTGHVWTAAEVERIRKMVVDGGCALIADECYADMVFEGHSLVSPLHYGTHPSVIVCRGFSKTLGAQSWRVGFAVSAPETVASMMAVMDPVYICVPLLQHAVGDYLSEHHEDYRNHIRELSCLMQGNWAILKEAFAKRFGWTPVDPQGTMYANFRHNCASDLEATKVALKAGVGVCPGTMFRKEGISEHGTTGTVRIHCGVSREKAQKIADVLLGQ